jgi:putative spermidine/putrescine transport system ATP-binding protein
VLEGSVTSGSGTALIRPESVSVHQDEDGNTNAVVASRAFLGPISRVYCDLDSGETVMAQVSSGVADRLPPGTRVRVSIDLSPVLVVGD